MDGLSAWWSEDPQSALVAELQASLLADQADAEDELFPPFDCDGIVIIEETS